MNDKIAVQRLEDYDALRVSAKLKEYGLDVANRVYAVLPDHLSSFGAFIDLRVEIDSFRPTHADGIEKLISISIDWPPAQAPVTARHSINVTSFSVTKGDVPIQSAALVVHDADLSITARLGELSATPGKLTICVSTPSLNTFQISVEALFLAYFREQISKHQGGASWATSYAKSPPKASSARN